MATYEEIKDIPNNPEVYLIDVRNREELEETGAIPESINIPCLTRSFYTFQGSNFKQKIMATYEEIKDIPNHPEVYLIDVRNKDELASTGAIPASINIPLPELEAAFNMSENDFKTNFNREKPTEKTALIFSCLKGGRAQKATDMALSKGFENVKPYPGSWTEWAQKEGL